MKKHKVVLLYTDKASKIVLRFVRKELFYHDEVLKVRENSGYVNQDLYILSNEAIKEDDWYYSKDYNDIRKSIDTERYSSDIKIIATTNYELHKSGIAKISDADIQWYISEWNKNKIKEVELEYKRIEEENFSKSAILKIEYNLKLTESGCVIIYKDRTESDYEFMIQNCLQDKFDEGYSQRMKDEKKEGNFVSNNPNENAKDYRVYTREEVKKFALKTTIENWQNYSLLKTKNWIDENI